MKKYIALIVFTFQISHANWLTSYEDAQKMALTTNRFIIIDFWATWCGPCLEMEKNVWNNEQLQETLQGFVKLKIDIDSNRELATKYGINGIPNILIIDANGKVIHNILGYQNTSNLKSEIEKFNLSTEFLSVDLINYFKAKNFSTTIKITQKYYDFSLLIDKNIKKKVFNICREYLNDYKITLDKKEIDYLKKSQKIELYKLYELAYNFEFNKLNKKISEFKTEEIDPINEYSYWFLKYLAVKGTSKTASDIEETLKNKGLESVINKGNELYSFYIK
ncbi:thioredoxin family protein [Flavobacterium phragmitis]|uniref:Thioredoxin n=1 Tax=Flavobacterium phragmitis TaxID=739143 RepID=A0A1I1K3C3_9FLAO|nr:thioredoxin domain-containing protein [Flavobacterium phragmitis]SFC55011.1 Thioredoxin [Flavobacterium phragmitis]